MSDPTPLAARIARLRFDVEDVVYIYIDGAGFVTFKADILAVCEAAEKPQWTVTPVGRRQIQAAALRDEAADYRGLPHTYTADEVADQLELRATAIEKETI